MSPRTGGGRSLGRGSLPLPPLKTRGRQRLGNSTWNTLLMGATLKQAKLLSWRTHFTWRPIVMLTYGPAGKEHPVLNTSPILAS
ncbi:hypothetical protein E2C01_004379 [Portunus trituberculatus]|uniref:Uncharacterized protein n=1 Tax=Portunus trituberculatus TaxID=210409 RepID=A0A5B7CTW6_PORTR|nr:hypothetical protein [Portunus trituberculatus]